MEIIKDKEFGGERPLFGAENVKLEGVTIHTGESALKFCKNIVAENCRFEGKYPFWHTEGFEVVNCLFTPGARAALWYSKNLLMRHTLVEAPKMFRDMEGIDLDDVKLPDAQETLWHCRGVKLRNVEVKNADYIFQHTDDINIANYRQEGNYSFQYCHNVEIRDAVIHSKDAFWNTENVTVYDSTVIGEYLGWYSKNLRLVRCHLGGTQPLCYCEGLVLEDCTFDADADLAFEDSDVQATVKSAITSVKNPRTGHIKAKSIGELIIDEHLRQPGDCVIETEE